MSRHKNPRLLVYPVPVLQDGQLGYQCTLQDGGVEKIMLIPIPPPAPRVADLVRYWCRRLGFDIIHSMHYDGVNKLFIFDLEKAGV